MGEPFEELRAVASQLAGLLVLAALNQAAESAHAAVPAVRATYEGASEAIQAAAVPAQARHHHHHLVRAALLIERVLERTEREGPPCTDTEVEETARLIEKGWQELRWSARALPGFEIVALDKACCACHGGPAFAGPSTLSI